MRNLRRTVLTLIFAAAAGSSPILAQTAAIDFDPARDGFPFPNYRNEGQRWKNDLIPEDLARMFGANTSCDALDAQRNCKVLRASASQWKEEMLEAMDIGRCEGMAVACLRLKEGLPFKGRRTPASFQAGATRAFGLQRTESLENYFAYYWVTQTFDEVKKMTAQTAAAGPASIAEMLSAGFSQDADTFVLRFAKFDPKTNRIFEPHAVTPFAIEQRADRFVISVYDSNFPGQTRFLTIFRAGTQRWEYNSKADLRARPDYFGDVSTKTLSVTATSWREGRCFASRWRTAIERTGCGIAENRRGFSIINASFAQRGTDTAEFFLTDEGDMLVTDPNGDRIGYDPKESFFFDEIEGSMLSQLVGGYFEDVPHYTVPYIESDEFAYSIVFSGKYLDEESDLDFVYAAPYFTVGFSGIRLDPKENLEAIVSTNGEQITFIASADSETPEVFYAFDSENENSPSYFAYVEGITLSAGKRLTYDFDFDAGKLLLTDDDGNQDRYDLTIVRLNPDGSMQTFQQNDVALGKADRYEIEFGTWDGENEMCFRVDEEGNGFADEECIEQDNEEPN